MTMKDWLGYIVPAILAIAGSFAATADKVDSRVAYENCQAVEDLKRDLRTALEIIPGAEEKATADFQRITLGLFEEDDCSDRIEP